METGPPAFNFSTSRNPNPRAAHVHLVRSKQFPSSSARGVPLQQSARVIYGLKTTRRRSVITSMRWLRFIENLQSGHVSVQAKHRDTTLSFSLEHPVSSSKNESCTDSLYWLERKRTVRRMTPSQGWFEDCGEEGQTRCCS